MGGGRRDDRTIWMKQMGSAFELPCVCVYFRREHAREGIQDKALHWVSFKEM